MISEVSKLHPGMSVIIDRGVDPFDSYVGKVVECLMTKSGDFIHLVEIEMSHEWHYGMYEEDNLKEIQEGKQMDYSNLVSVVNSLSKLVEEQKKEIEHISSDNSQNSTNYAYAKKRCSELESKLEKQNELIEHLQDEFNRASRMIQASDKELAKAKLANHDKNNTVLIDIATKLLLARGKENCQKWQEGSVLNDDTSYVGAIKAVRTATGWSLKEAKDFVEAFQWPDTNRQ